MPDKFQICPIELALQGMRESLKVLERPDLTQLDAFTHFSHFLTRSSQARNQFIREFKRRTGRKVGRNWSGEPWKAPISDQAVAKLFVSLRDDDFHGEPLVVLIDEETSFALHMPDGTISEMKLNVRMTATEAQGLFRAGDGPQMRMYVNGTTGERDGDPVDVIDYKRHYVLHGGSSAVRSLLDDLGTDDIVELARREMGALEEYRKWFEDEFPDSGPEVPDPCRWQG